MYMFKLKDYFDIYFYKVSICYIYRIFVIIFNVNIYF